MKIRFSFKTLLIFVTLVAIAVGSFGVRLNSSHRQRNAVAALTTAGLRVSYDYETPSMRGLSIDPFNDPTYVNQKATLWAIEPIGPVRLWLGRRFGRDFVCDVREVYANQPLPPDLVRRIGDLRSIEFLQLNARQHINVQEPFSDEAWQAFVACRNVERLKLDRDQFNPTRRLAGLAAWQQLRSLTVEGGEFNLVDAQEVARLTGLEHLSLQLVKTNDEILVPLARLKRVEDFSLTHAGHGHEVTAGGVAFLADLPHLRVLTLARMPSMTDEICSVLEKMPQLESLNLDQASVNGSSFDRLARLKNLKLLNLIGTHVNDAALEKLSRLTQLEELDLSSTRVTDAGVKHLAALVNLRFLRLGGNPITDEGIRSLAALTELQVLTLSHTELTDAGLNHLSGLTNLSTLWLGSEVKVSPAAVAELKKQLPSCQIIQN
jgi:hypothetical protein